MNRAENYNSPAYDTKERKDHEESQELRFINTLFYRHEELLSKYEVDERFFLEGGKALDLFRKIVLVLDKNGSLGTPKEFFAYVKTQYKTEYDGDTQKVLEKDYGLDYNLLYNTLNTQFKKRILATLSVGISDSLKEGEEGIEAQIALVSDLLREIHIVGYRSAGKPLEEEIETIMSEIRIGRKRETNPCIFTGFPLFDNYNFGVRNGQVISIVAGTGVGKTTLCMNMMYNMAFQGHKCGYLSSEMSARELVEKIMGIHSYKNVALQTPIWQITNLTADKEKMEQVSEEVKDLPIIIDDELNTFSDADFEPRLRSFISKNKLQVVFIDHIYQLRDSGKTKGKKNVMFENIMNSLKTLAKEMGVPIVQTIHINRDKMRTGDLRLSDIKDSSSIEQVSDIVVALQRVNDYEFKENEVELKYKMIKNRAGQNNVEHQVKYYTQTQKMIDRSKLSKEAEELQDLALKLG